MSVSYLWALLVKDPLIVAATVFMGALSVCVSFFDREQRITDRIARAWAQMLVSIAGIRLRISGLENVDPGRNYVFIGNHLSLYDTPVLLSTVPNQFLFLVNAKYVRMPFLGTHLRRTGHFAVDQEDARGSLKILTEAARAMRERGVSVLLFPGGLSCPGPDRRVQGRRGVHSDQVGRAGDSLRHPRNPGGFARRQCSCSRRASRDHLRQANPHR